MTQSHTIMTSNCYLLFDFFTTNIPKINISVSEFAALTDAGEGVVREV